MNMKRIAFGLLILTLLSCNFVTQMITPPTVTPQPTVTLTPSATPQATPTVLAPAYIPPQCANKPIATVPPDVAEAQPTLNAPTNPDISKTEQLQIFNDMTHTVDTVYVYPDFNGKDWTAIKVKYKSMIDAGLDTSAFYDQMRAMIGELGDNHSDYLSPADVQESDAELKGENKYVGVGVYGDYNFDKNSFVVISTLPGSAAEHAGLQSHDSIILVDGLPITKELGNRLRGPECSAVVAKIESPDSPPHDVMLIRYRIDGSVPLDARLVNTTDGSKIGYIFLPSFFDETLPPQMEAALNKFGPLDGLILDLRLNGGGSSTVAYPIMSFFTKGKLGDFVSRKETHSLEIQANPIQNSQTVPLVVLVGKDTVSFGEIFSGIMQDSKRAKIVGETSMGNVEILRGYDFQDGSLMWLASERFKSAFSDVNWEGRGVIPDVQAVALWDSFEFDTDPAIKASLGLLGHK
jgi:carboxyl-terminal processing protease